MSTKGTSGSIPLAGMSSAERTDEYAEHAPVLSTAGTQGCKHSSAAPYMTNANYRIMPPSPGAKGMPEVQSSGGGARATVSGLPSWISPASGSKTYFPASSPVISSDGESASGGRGMGAFADSETTYGSGCSPNGDTGHHMSAGDVQELRTEYDVLPYEIHAWSSHSANFLPHNILTDRPHDQASRWSTNANNHRQFITLRLEHPALVRSIKFGKFYKTHVCNLREFKVFGGMSQDNMIELLYSGLRNDSEAETISLKQKFNGCYIPCQYIKIQPLLAHDQKFNFSVWFVELRGTMDPQIMQRIIHRFDKLKEQEVVRSCLKFFRDRNYSTAFNALQQQTQICLEAPLLTSLHEALVEKGDYDRVEQLLCQAEREGMFASCISRIPYGPAWRQVDPNMFPVPPARGGHQMCVDEESREAYLYGGWDGANNLGDLWVLKMDTGKWTCISTNTRDQGGPGPRSCHAMCFDSVHKCLYIMGRYIDHEYRGNTGLENDLFCYDTLHNEWIVLSENTEVMEGPKLVFNAQMVFDPRYCCIYVYGGKVVLPDASDSTIVYSGMYRYDLRRHKWTKLKPDFHMLDQEQHVRGRYFHTMQIDAELQRLYVLSSKRDVSSPGDLFIYDIASNTFFERMQDLAVTSSTRQPMTQQRYLAEQQRLNPAYSAVHARPLPPPDTSDHHPHHVHLVQDGRTIRATLDTERQELYVLASVQNESNLVAGPSLQALMSMRGGRDLATGFYGQGDAHSSPASYAYSTGAGFHPCSSLMDSGVRYESRRFAGTSGVGSSIAQDGVKAGQRFADRGASGPGDQRGYQMQSDHVLMVVMCYHIPTETWTEVYNSECTPLMLAPSMAPSSDDSLAAVGMSEKDAACSNKRCGTQPSSRLAFGCNDGAGSMPPFPVPRFAQDWVFDRSTHRHFMFGGNPNRPNDKSARFNDTWELQFSRPTPQDILRRALYLVRQRRFLDMCAGVETASGQPNGCTPGIPPGNGDGVAEDAGSYRDDELKASAIPSPNSALADGAEPAALSAKRLSPLASNVDAPHQRQKRATAPGLDTTGPLCPPYGSTARSLAYLQQHVAPLVNHDDPSESQSFHALSTALFQISSGSRTSAGSARSKLRPDSGDCTPEALCKARADVYEALLFYFPERQQQPPSQLDDLVPMMMS
ncbi:hypothetical protein GQ54DRAFT_178910 [Martensiomyces pterosporus]|nr:hypothetical protein GQ54DRAFT_178910 [Martensiomyces pterosporus]